MMDDFRVDMTVPVGEFELLLLGAVRDQLRRISSPVALIEIVEARASVLGHAFRTDLAREIIEATPIDSADTKAWRRALRALEVGA